MHEPGKWKCDRCGAEISGYVGQFNLDLWNDIFSTLDNPKKINERKLDRLINSPDLCPSCKSKWSKLMKRQAQERMIFMGIKEAKNGT